MNTSNPFTFLRPLGTLMILFAAGAAAQSTIAFPMNYYLGAQPDFLLTIVLCAALLSDAATGCVLGFIGGLLSSALVGQTVGTLLVSRTAAGFMAGHFTARIFEANTLVVVLGVLATSFAASILQILVAPPRFGLAFWLQATIGGAIWNALFSIPISGLLRQSGWGAPKPRLR